MVRCHCIGAGQALPFMVLWGKHLGDFWLVPSGSPPTFLILFALCVQEVGRCWTSGWESLTLACDEPQKGTPMTESEWLECSDPKLMLRFFWGMRVCRKLRLFACACCRAVWPTMTDKRSQVSVELGEGYADGTVTDEERRAVTVEAHRVKKQGGSVELVRAAASCSGRVAYQAALRAIHSSMVESRVRVEILRCVHGNPFHPSPSTPFGSRQP